MGKMWEQHSKRIFQGHRKFFPARMFMSAFMKAFLKVIESNQINSYLHSFFVTKGLINQLLHIDLDVQSFDSSGTNIATGYFHL